MCLGCFVCSGGDSAAAAAGSKFRFTRADFGPLKFLPLHYDLNLDIDGVTTRVTARQTYLYQGVGAATELVLNAHDLVIERVAVYSARSAPPLGPPPVGLEAVVPDFVAHVRILDTLTPTPAPFAHDTHKRLLTIQLGREVHPGEEIVIYTLSTCSANNSNLEGIYLDFTPPGAPPTLITQCQQYGFQRIVPCIDAMTSKTFYTTTIVADARYTNLVSNGDLAPGFHNDAGEAVYEAVGDSRKKIVFHNHKVNMAPYLFFLGAGTYEVHTRECEYPSGDQFQLELFCIPGVVAAPSDAKAALAALHDSILWVHLSTGPEAGQHGPARARTYELLAEREGLKALALPSADDVARLAAVRASLKTLVAEWGVTGYTYTGTVYREIAMENSNYGGMENVGNTTIISSKLTPSPWLSDLGYVYMEGVKVHEYYHNINGSQVTGSSPFEIWLNEAVTVHVQREREDALFGHDFMRLGQVVYARTPGSGPLAQDDSPVAMAIEPAGFNTTHELISAMTYSKAPEFVAMVQTVLGREAFVTALHEYHTKYAFSNATSAQWIACMAAHAPAGVDMGRMAAGWLGRAGHPTITLTAAAYSADTQTYTLELAQGGFEGKGDGAPWVVPVKFALVKDGAVIHSGLQIFDSSSVSITVGNIAVAPDFVSVAPDFSFFGEVKDAVSTPEQQLLQARADPDIVNRYLAFQALLDEEKAALVDALRAGAQSLVSVSAHIVTLLGEILADEQLSVASRGRFLDITAAVASRPDLSHLYAHLADARTAILQAFYAAHGALLHATFEDLLELSQAAGATQRNTLMLRGLKFACFNAIRAGLVTPPALRREAVPAASHAADRARVVALAQAVFDSPFMSDKYFALLSMLEVGGPEAAAAQAVAVAQWTQHPIGCEQYIMCVASVDSAATPALLRALVTGPFFNVALAGHARTLARGWLTNRKRALLTADGLKLTVDLFLLIGKVNQMSAYGFLLAFDQVSHFEAGVKRVLLAALHAMRDGLDPVKEESLFNQLSRLVQI